MRPIIQKQGKSKRGVWTKAQKQYTERAVNFGCLACWFGRGIEGTPSQWHHSKENWHGGGMRCPHEFGLALCAIDHYLVHHHTKDFSLLVGMSESELVALSMKMFNWQS